MPNQDIDALPLLIIIAGLIFVLSIGLPVVVDALILGAVLFYFAER